MLTVLVLIARLVGQAVFYAGADSVLHHVLDCSRPGLLHRFQEPTMRRPRGGARLCPRRSHVLYVSMLLNGLRAPLVLETTFGLGSTAVGMIAWHLAIMSACVELPVCHISLKALSDPIFSCGCVAMLLRTFLSSDASRHFPNCCNSGGD